MTDATCADDLADALPPPGPRETRLGFLLRGFGAALLVVAVVLMAVAAVKPGP